jgi:spore germination protein GerM
MVKQQQNRRIPVSGLVAGIAAVAVTVGGGAAWWHWQSSQRQNQPGAPPISGIQEAPKPQTPPPVAQQQVEVFWLKESGVRQQLFATTAATTADIKKQPTAALETAFNDLLAGPKDSSVSTAIPQGTKLRSLKMENDGIHVDLSQEFTTGGGSTAMTGRVAQVVYTATSLDPKAKVWLEVEGEPLEVLGGEGLELEQPLTRRSLGENFTL